MQQPYGQQPPPTPPSYYQPPNYPPQQPRRGTFWRTLRLLVLRFFGGFGRVGSRLRPHWLLALFATLLFLVIAVEGFALILPSLAAMVSPQDRQRADSLPPAPAVETYIKGQREHDAELIWNSFSDSFKDELRQQGGSQTALANQIQQEQQSGQRYVKFDYVGGVSTNSGGKFFYLAQIESPNPQRNGMLSYVFTVDGDGKIAGIETGSSAR